MRRVLWYSLVSLVLGIIVNLYWYETIDKNCFIILLVGFIMGIINTIDINIFYKIKNKILKLLFLVIKPILYIGIVVGLLKINLEILNSILFGIICFSSLLLLLTSFLLLIIDLLITGISKIIKKLIKRKDKV